MGKKKKQRQIIERPDYHILFIGGKHFNLPAQRIKCRHTQYQQGSPELKRGEISFAHGEEPDMVLCFKDFLGHDNYDAFKKKASILGIPFVASKGGLGALAEAAYRAGNDDIYDYIVKDTKPARDQKAKEKELEDSLDLSWIFGEPPKRASVDIVRGERKIHTLRTPTGMSIMMKGDVLMEAIRIASDEGMGGGLRGQILPQEADKVAKIIDERYGLTERGIGISGNTIRRNIGIAFGNIADGSKPDKVANKRKASQKAAKKKAAASAEEEERIKASLKRDMKKVPAPRPVPGHELETFLAQMALHIQKMDHRLEQMLSLYERVLKAESENAGFVAQVVALEDIVQAKEDEIEKLKKKIIKLEKLITDQD
jgi:hypothetical protein